MRPVFNNRILVVDDDEMVCEVIRETLSAPQFSLNTNATMKRALSNGDRGDNSGDWCFTVETLNRGELAVSQVSESLKNGKPYAAIFLDVRMPGIDGIDTALRIRELDARAEIVFVTGFEDIGASEIANAVGRDVSYLNKPFLADEIRQAATRAVFSWNKNRLLEEVLVAMSGIPPSDLRTEEFVAQLAGMMTNFGEAHSVLIASFNKTGSDRLRVLYGAGIFADASVRENLVKHVSEDKKTLVLKDKVAFLARDGWILALHRDGMDLRKDEKFVLEIVLKNALLHLENYFLRLSLTEKERLSVMGEAVRMVVHDLKTPLTAIHGLAELAATNADDPVRSLEIQRLTSRAARNGMSLISDILSYSDSKLLERDPVRLVDLFADVHAAMEPYLLLSNIKLNFQHAELEMQLDRDRIARVLVNMARNACDALEISSTPNGLVSIGADSRGRDLVLWVDDNGPGMPPEMAAHLFDPFSTGKRRRGSGFGLAICRHFVEMHGGTIDVESKPGRTRFSMVLPDCVPQTK